MAITRRGFLSAAACSVLPFGLTTKLSYAAVPSEKRIVVILLRGAMDGLHLLQPYGDPLFEKMRPTLARSPDSSGMIILDDFYALYSPKREDALAKLWHDGELSFLQAVSTPYRNGRSHFVAQNMLETGSGIIGEHRDGWLRRMVSALPGVQRTQTLTLSPTQMALGAGSPSLQNWWPSATLSGDKATSQKLEALYEKDLAFHVAASDLMRLANNIETIQKDDERIGTILARTTAKLLNEDIRVAAFSLGGWDTHINQSKSMDPPITELGRTLMELKVNLKENWKSTTVLCVTEFGRTVQENGIGGTDHGTGGLALLAGGAIQGGKVFGQWPGLKEKDLLNGRDLQSQTDVREYISLLFSQSMGVPISKIGREVFPYLSINSKTPLV